MTFTSWLKYDLDIKKILICVKVMLIYVNITDRQTDRQTYQKYSSKPNKM